MREILFRAKRRDNREWAEGYYAFVSGISIIFQTSKFRVDKNGNFDIANGEEISPKTICQYTGLTDKNGNKIWENDIVTVPGEDDIFVIRWDSENAAFVIESDKLQCDFDNYSGSELEVIGNVFDNADLLEG